MFWTAAIAVAIPLVSVNAVCQKCERIREENARKAKDQNWVFYEDWEKMQKEESVSESDRSVDPEDKE